MDDAAVYKLDRKTALVVTADFIPPFIDDPYLFGQAAAANSLSDVYAMGGRPVTVLNLCMFPACGADKKDLASILRGGLDKTEEAGALLVGGHTVGSDELMYGLSVNGIVPTGRYTPNSGARKNDRFILTKPIGSGVYIMGFRNGAVARDEMLGVAKKLAKLNKTACETMMEFGAAGATDITGFGLGGHALFMARASKLGIRFFYDAIPRFPKTLDLIANGVKTGLTGPNQRLLGADIAFRGGFTKDEKAIFVDPQTSGGLFFGVRAGDAEACLRKLHERGVADARIVGEAFPAGKPRLEVLRG